MKKIIYPLILFIISPMIGASEFCIQTFNTYGVYGKGDLFQRKLSKRTEAFLERANAEEFCDIWQLQELWAKRQYKKMKRSQVFKDHHLVRPKGEALRGMNTGLGFGIKGEVKSNHSFAFKRNMPGNDGGIRKLLKIGKGASIRDVELPSGEVLTLVNLHLHPLLGGSIHRAINASHAIEVFEKLMDKMPLSSPLIITGDFNVSPSSLVIEAFKNLFVLKDAYLEQNGNYGGQCTYCGLPLQKNYSIIDFVFYHNGETKELRPTSAVINLESTRSSSFSDHHGVRIKFNPLSKKAVKTSQLTERQKKAKESLMKLKAILPADYQVEVAKIERLIGKIENDNNYLNYLKRD